MPCFKRVRGCPQPPLVTVPCRADAHTAGPALTSITDVKPYIHGFRSDTIRHNLEAARAALDLLRDVEMGRHQPVAGRHAHAAVVVGARVKTWCVALLMIRTNG